MPELPEVETVRRGLTRLVGGATIQSVTVLYPKMVSPEAATFVADLTGKTIEKKLTGVGSTYCSGLMVISRWCPTFGWRESTMFSPQAHR